MKEIGYVSEDNFELEVYECDCGFHIGLDSTFLDQVGDITITCPSCEETFTILEHEL